MAEKEDYIVISKKDFDYKKGHYVTHSAKQMSHTEAIERMAKAICREDNCLDSCEECILGFGSTAEEKEQFCQKQIIMSRDLSASYVSRAESALNALLEVKK